MPSNNALLNLQWIEGRGPVGRSVFYWEISGPNLDPSTGYPD